MKKFIKSKQGFTLIELLISLSILAVLSGVLITLQRDIFSVNGFLNDSFIAYRDAQSAMTIIAPQVRSAGQSNVGGFALEITEPNSFAFYSNVDSDSYRERVHYFLQGDTLMQSIIKPEGNPLTYSTSTASESLRPILKHIAATSTPIFSYFGSDYKGTSTPLADPVVPSDVRLVKISLIVDDNPLLPPPPITVSSQINLRNLRTGE
ncbi:MAG: hypothetical protein COU07_00895 [Candidatus Harrisonbacteria bacterium CG10_big_fil_rev_8_21_14_0_10_40_38]|uniref:Type II secretion system protein J n=1 Tax=Candidatus Harrisonbacteria bacterium CG10_big_fil_rev_8_21_14_0_10_40_38 TaxID=1974583 RepID=A0A2H0UST8_9BACT|nr:MAG: hypothetical protein COU07_00895 [Candidatus Harrisonbacteria bacterium CG10_big_fil_rev_8_21_14_0_10_40_38]